MVVNGSSLGDGAALFSKEERDRRWHLVRKRMEEEGLDVLLTAPNSGLWDQLQAHARWLTCIGGNCTGVSVVLPRDGDITVVTSPIPAPDFWRRWQGWVTDVRATPWAVGAGVEARLRELDIGSGRIGIAGLAGSPRFPEGLASTGFIEAVRAACPGASIVDATPWMNALRDVKNLEEIEAIRHSVKICEAGMDVLRQEARPGVPERVVYGRMTGKMIELGSVPPNMLQWGAGNLSGHTLVPFPTNRPLAENDILFLEVESRFKGYLGQVTQMAVLGDIPAELAAMFDVVVSTITRMRELLHPGARLGAVVEACRASTVGSPYDVFPILHARALGEDDPMIIFNTTDPRVLDWPVRENQTYAIKCQVRTRNGGGMAFWGESMRIAAEGAERLGSMPMEIIRLG